jgi:hypothetical protein
MILWNIWRVVIAAAIIVAVVEHSKRNWRNGWLLFSPPLVSNLAVAMQYRQRRKYR